MNQIFFNSIRLNRNCINISVTNLVFRILDICYTNRPYDCVLGDGQFLKIIGDK